jgi:Rrf2 family protein
MLFSTATGYALQTLAALPGDGSYRLARNLAGQLHLPGPYLAKILQNLVQAGILESVRGPRGGFRLARPAQEVTVGDVVEALEGPGYLHGCVMGFAHCSSENPCPMHEAWSRVKAQMNASMTQATIQDLQQFRS